MQPSARLQEWRPLVDEAVRHFKDAGCAESDIRGALKNHYCASQLDLGPDPEPNQVCPRPRCAESPNLRPLRLAGPPWEDLHQLLSPASTVLRQDSRPRSRPWSPAGLPSK